MSTFSRSQKIAAISLMITSIALIAGLRFRHTIQTFMSQATGVPASFIINTAQYRGRLNRPWRSLAQGGESPQYRFLPVYDKILRLEPTYIRIDHIYDFYDIVSRNQNGQITYNWTKLDRVLDDIAHTGATPFIALSYMPPELSSGDITGAPNNWVEWQNLVQATIEHISGRNARNTPNVYYEVWNEPDLFGGWKTYGDKNYLTLYHYAALGAKKARNVQSYKFGGPATTALYRNWVTRLLDYTSKNDLPLDFYSWHQYTYDAHSFRQAIETYKSYVRTDPRAALIEPIITEWGPNSEVHSVYDSRIAAAHTIASVSQMLPDLSKAFIFEIQDGLDPNGAQYWGRWGVLTHQQFGSNPKPRYTAIQWLNRLGDTQLSMIGQGSWVKGIASVDDTGTIKVILTNYDPYNRHTETFPVIFRWLDPGTYQLTQEIMQGGTTSREFYITSNAWNHQVTLPPNYSAFLTLQKK